ncbi:hypothetical protein ACFO8O_16295 [Hephaestia sp. GCM10023244]|uniref:hypothetical protein n=1 Tax=unclassified Hephaestia TaxID=2631281 RepID=UPI0020773577|nr:hypothetical protein [Hephaestia sp. MAHUQ-44]MCM8732521.1 hypothetical protein [Hephaestia sp. MAHUQ-44]
MTGVLPAIGRRWTTIGSTLISLAILATALYQLHGTRVTDILALVPHNPAFWLVFVIAYLVTPASEWVIYHHLWSIPTSGMIALLRKRVANEIVLGYLGEVYFYAWVRRTGLITRSAPFGAIKDVAILSALTGNAVTLAMLAAAIPFFGLLQLNLGGKAVLYSLGVLAVTSFAMLLLRKRLFTLPRPELWRIAAIHLARILATIGLTALMWHLVLSAVGLVWWLILATLRQLLSRLPLMPNKDLAFVSLAIFVVGRDGDVAAMIAMIGGLILLTHLLVGSALGAAGLIRREAVV